MVEHETQLSIELLDENNIEFAVRMSSDAGWNQTRNDWNRVIDYEPHGCFLARWDGQPAGTVTTSSYGVARARRERVSAARAVTVPGSVGWIGMMLVQQDFRRKGIASALMQQALHYLQRTGVECTKLDATPVGEKVYARLGFQSEWSFHRWARNADAVNVPVKPSFQQHECRDLDFQAFGADRNELLRRLGRESVVVTRADGFGMLRSGRIAGYLGPIIAADPHTAEGIVQELLSQTSGPVFWDVPSSNLSAVQLAMTCGFDAVRDLKRMWHGTRAATPNMNLQYALMDPGKG